VDVFSSPVMMFYPREIPQGSSHRTAAVRLEPEEAADSGVAGDIVCSGNFDRLGGRIRVTLSWRGEATLACARCGGEFAQTFEGTFETLVVPLAVTDEGAEFSYADEAQEVDLRPSVYDDIMITLPLSPLCSDSCTGPADAPGYLVESDSRWDALKKLK